MISIIIIVEGKTEVNFVKCVLAPYLGTKSVFVSPRDLRGNVTVKKIKEFINVASYEANYVTTLVDLYGFKNGSDKFEIENEIIEGLSEDLKKKCIPYVQQYEFEGLLFSNPKSIGDVLNDPKLSEKAQNILKQFDNEPENINNSPQTSPAKRLIKLSNNRYKKTMHGYQIAKKIGLDKIKEMCPNFKNWLSELENLPTEK